MTLLEAPCVFCGYNGVGYYQPKTHPSHCPWHLIGGEAERLGRLRAEVKRLRVARAGELREAWLSGYRALDHLNEEAEAARRYPDPPEKTLPTIEEVSGCLGSFSVREQMNNLRGKPDPPEEKT